MAAPTIRKALISSFATSPSDISNLTVITAAHPPPPPRNHVQIRVLYSGFSGADVNMARGTYPLQRKPPFTPGYCLVGVVSTLPSPSPSAPVPEPAGFQLGDHIAAITTYNSQSTSLNLPSSLLVKIPSSLLTLAQSSNLNKNTDTLLQQITALTLDWSTAFGMLSPSCAAVSPGQRVFIHGLSGAVGQALLSLSLLAGAEVYGTASPRNHAALLAAGVKGVYDYRDKTWISGMKDVGGADVVFDPLGFESWDQSWGVLSGTGVLVGYGGNQGALNEGEKRRSPFPYIGKLVLRGLAPWGGKRSEFYYIKPGSEEWRRGLVELMGMLEGGKIEVPVKRVLDLTTEGLREAHRSWGKIEGMGSLVIRVSGVEE